MSESKIWMISNCESESVSIPTRLSLLSISIDRVRCRGRRRLNSAKHNEVVWKWISLCAEPPYTYRTPHRPESEGEGIRVRESRLIYLSILISLINSLFILKNFEHLYKTSQLLSKNFKQSLLPKSCEKQLITLCTID